MPAQRYLAIYLGSVEAREKAERAGTITEATMQAGMAAWGEWVARHGDAIVDIGSPLGKTSGIAFNRASFGFAFRKRPAIFAIIFRVDAGSFRTITVLSPKAIGFEFRPDRTFRLY